MTFSPREYRALLRTHLPAFTQKVFHTIAPGEAYVHGPHIDAIAHQLQRVGSGEERRLLITVPPRHMKSIMASVAFPAWLLGHDPTCKIMCISYGGDLATKHHKDFKMVVSSPWYRDLFPATVRGVRRATDTEFTTAQNGSRLATSLNGAITGLGADILIIDDLMKAGDASSAVERQRLKDMYGPVIYTRQNNQTRGAIVAIQQRLHEDDFAAFLMQQGGFHHLNLPAIAVKDEDIALGAGRVLSRRVGDVLFPGQQPLEALDDIRRALGPTEFSAQYQQEPVTPGGNLLRWERVPTYDEAPQRRLLVKVVQSWDVAVTATPRSDWSVCSTWGFAGQAWHLLDVDRVRLEFPALLGMVKTLRKKWGAELLLVDEVGAGRPLLDQLRWDYRHAGYNAEWRVSGRSASVDKVTRFAGVTAILESDAIAFPSSAPFLDNLRKELIAFPNGTHDDQVDSITQFLEWSIKGRGAFELTYNRNHPPGRERADPPRALGLHYPTDGLARSAGIAR